MTELALLIDVELRYIICNYVFSFYKNIEKRLVFYLNSGYSRSTKN